MNLYRTLGLTGLLLGIVGTAAAGDYGDRVDRRLDRKGDRIEHRLDDKGDRIEQRYDRRADWADRHGYHHAADHLDARGDRIDRRLKRRLEPQSDQAEGAERPHVVAAE